MNQIRKGNEAAFFCERVSFRRGDQGRPLGGSSLCEETRQMVKCTRREAQAGGTTKAEAQRRKLQDGPGSGTQSSQDSEFVRLQLAEAGLQASCTLHPQGPQACRLPLRARAVGGAGLTCGAGLPDATPLGGPARRPRPRRPRPRPETGRSWEPRGCAALGTRPGAARRGGPGAGRAQVGAGSAGRGSRGPRGWRRGGG